MNAAIQDAVNLGWKLAFAAARPGERAACWTPTTGNAGRWRARCWR